MTSTFKRLPRLAFDPWYAVAMGVCAFLLAVPLTMLGFVSLVTWHLVSPTGAYPAQEKRAVQIAEHYDQGRYDAVVEVYERPLDIPLASRVSWRNRTGMFRSVGIDTLVEVGHAYQFTGDARNAEHHYVLALGWNVAQYREHCRESDRCPDLDDLKTFAEFRRDFSRW